jgi:UDP-glucuronate 4-epimerase
MKYLVTGGAGFIGSALARSLVEDGHQVVAIDNLNDYYDISLKKDRVQNLPAEVSFIQMDVNDPKLLDLCQQEKFDGICHLATQAGVRYSLEAPGEYIANNYVATFTILEIAKKADIKKVIFASTSSVYGESDNVPFSEDFAADTPVSVYAATKRGSEILAHSYHTLYGIDFIALRFFTVYGPWGRPDMAPFIFTDKIIRGESIRVFNQGEMRRDFTYIDDIVAGVVAALERVSGYEIYNLGNGSPVKLLDFINAIEAAVGTPAQLEMAPMQAGDVTQTYADITKAKAALDYQPTTRLADGVQAYVDWYREYYQVN